MMADDMTSEEGNGGEGDQEGPGSVIEALLEPGPTQIQESQPAGGVETRESTAEGGSDGESSTGGSGSAAESDDAESSAEDEEEGLDGQSPKLSRKRKRGQEESPGKIPCRYGVLYLYGVSFEMQIEAQREIRGQRQGFWYRCGQAEEPRKSHHRTQFRATYAPSAVAGGMGWRTPRLRRRGGKPRAVARRSSRTPMSTEHTRFALCFCLAAWL